MFFKIIGSIIILLSSSFLGFILSKDCSMRPQQLRELQGLLQMLENEISYMANLLTDAFYKMHEVRKNEISLIFKQAADYLTADTGLNASEAWERALKENIKKTALNEEDEKILISFGKMLGKSDVEGQLKNIKLAMKQLEIQEKKAEESKAKNEAMYKRLGVLCGLALIIILV
ncbi:MAG TPA: stage III sporulation protein AB [Clostridiaceae bacterium]|nr:stage III sporulation protein AB [Clostridiaceae bacterium]